jgi:hypothetical protein
LVPGFAGRAADSFFGWGLPVEETEELREFEVPAEEVKSAA